MSPLGLLLCCVDLLVRVKRRADRHHFYPKRNKKQMTESTDQRLDALLGELRRRNRLTTVSISPEEHNAILVALKRIPKLERDLRSQDDFIQQLHEDCGELIKRAERVEAAAQKLAQCAQEAVDADNPFIRHQLTELGVALQQYRAASAEEGSND